MIMELWCLIAGVICYIAYGYVVLVFAEYHTLWMDGIRLDLQTKIFIVLSWPMFAFTWLLGEFLTRRGHK